jgi:hypothetical protein
MNTKNFFHHFLSSQKVTKKDLTKRTCSACGCAWTAFCLNGGFCLRFAVLYHDPDLFSFTGRCPVLRSDGPSGLASRSILWLKAINNLAQGNAL